MADEKRVPWSVCLTTDNYTYWSYTDDTGKVVYNCTTGQPPTTEGGYYNLDSLRKLKNDV